ncbi:MULTISPECIES: GtrA family protein [Pseudomonas]|uniref:GtrA family protein n=1 Tax=Pseudomonas coleopterorum TaxID=1605838 RepID=A0ABR9BZE4_9PSED|nr:MULTISPECIES: GtrA family protein [Pseudomonas]MBD8754094.1 GtrA family protein [Pseudomonas coleopterorum]MBD8769813.1 GtrA family protein [Pseudomonas coleopterorum]
MRPTATDLFPSRRQSPVIPRLIEILSGIGYKIVRGLLPLTLISFLIVGSLGLIVHMSVLKTLMYFVTDNFRYANGCSMAVAATFNYLMNNRATYSDVSLSGKRIVIGYMLYLSIASAGLGLSLLISGEVYDRTVMPMVSAFCGIVVGSLWNYFMSYNFVWKLLSAKDRPVKI